MSVFIASLVVTMLTTGVIVLALQRKWLQHMRTRHPTSWTALGNPRQVGSSVAVQWRVLKFIQTGRYRDLNDSDLDDLTRTLGRWSIVYIALFALTAAAFLAFLFVN